MTIHNNCLIGNSKDIEISIKAWYLSLSLYIYIYIYIYVCVCVCVCVRYIYTCEVYIYIYIYKHLFMWGIYIYTCVIYIYIYIYMSKVGDCCWNWHKSYIFDSYYTGLLHFTLDPYLIMLSVKQGDIKNHVLSLCYDSTWDWTQVFRASGEHSNSHTNSIYIYIYIERERERESERVKYQYMWNRVISTYSC